MNIQDWPVSTNIEDRRSLSDAWFDLIPAEVSPPSESYNLAFVGNTDFVAGLLIGAGVALAVWVIWLLAQETRRLA